MSKELKNITESVMEQIHLGKAKMKPKMYFIIGSILTFIGLISSVIVSTFLVGLTRFSLRAHGPMGQYRFDQIISNFPWWTLVFAVFGLGLLIKIWRKLSPDYAVFAAVSFVMPLFSPTLLALPRYLLTIFPVFIVLSFYKNQYLIFAYQIFSILLLAVFAVLFITGNWVS